MFISFGKPANKPIKKVRIPAQQPNNNQTHSTGYRVQKTVLIVCPYPVPVFFSERI
jgi:hypothetical protein